MAGKVYEVRRFSMVLGITSSTANVFVRNIQEARAEARAIASLAGYAEVWLCSINPGLTEKRLLIEALNGGQWCSNKRKVETYGEEPPDYTGPSVPYETVRAIIASDDDEPEDEPEDDGTSGLSDNEDGAI